jgi:hypothetical protein
MDEVKKGQNNQNYINKQYNSKWRWRRDKENEEGK